MSEEENRERLQALAAKPYRGICELHPYSLWFFDTEDEAAQKMTEHLAAEHPNLVRWGPA